MTTNGPDLADVKERIAGCLLGGAVGDALGAPVEFMSFDEILQSVKCARTGPTAARSRT